MPVGETIQQNNRRPCRGRAMQNAFPVCMAKAKLMLSASFLKCRIPPSGKTAYAGFSEAACKRNSLVFSAFGLKYLLWINK
jgi:hypothetical protein